MFDLLFKMMKKINFSFITEHYYDELKFDPKLKKDFFDFYIYIKPLFDLHKINFNQKELLKLFWKKIFKLSFKEKSEIIKNNFFITYFLNKNEFKKYVEKFSKNGSWWMFAATFNNEYKKLNVYISNKSFSLPQAGRFMLNNQNIKSEFIKKFLNKITIQDFYTLDGTYLSWEEFIFLIEKSELDVKKYLLHLAIKTHGMACDLIVDGLAKLDKNNFRNIKKDKKFEKKLYKIRDEPFNKRNLEKSLEIPFSSEKMLEQYKKIKLVYQIFNLPPKINYYDHPFESLKEKKSVDINYDTTQVNENYYFCFDGFMDYYFKFYNGYLKWFFKKNKKLEKIVIHKSDNDNLIRMNKILIKWINEKDLEISSFIALKFLKESILLLFPNKKEYFQKNSFYLAAREAAKIFEDKIKWTTEILFAPTPYFKHNNVRNEICHFRTKDLIIGFKIMCLAMQYFIKWMKKNQILGKN